MGCTSCGTDNGKPSGCKSNGGCSSGGCNRLNVHDWLANLPFSDPEGSCRIIEVSFNQGSRKEFFRNNTLQTFFKGDLITVEGVSGFDVGTVNLTGELVRLQLKKRRVQEDSAEIKKVLRKSNDLDIQKWKESKAREKEALIRSRAIARQLKLNMKLGEVEIQADGRKATFFYIADDRVDFRELIKVYAGEFRVKVEMKQIGARQESAKVGGIGSCGRELCCSSWLSDFKSVTTSIARYQNLSINQTKLSGQCGRLKCCLNYELDTYLDALQHFPTHSDILETEKGNAILIKKDIFKNLMWYVLPDSNRHYPLDIETVRNIKALNQKGVKATAVDFVESVQVTKTKEPETQFVELVGQISLRSLEKQSQKKRQKDQRSRDTGRSGRPEGRSEGNRGDQRPPGGERSGRNEGRPQGRTEGNRGDQRQQGGETGGRNEARPQGRDAQRGQNPPRQDKPRGDQRPGDQRSGDQRRGDQRRGGGEGGGRNEGRPQGPRPNANRNEPRSGPGPKLEKPGSGTQGNPNPSNPAPQGPAPE
jgi:cell fate regulator YaaT (PSP1 superfamily)